MLLTATKIKQTAVSLIAATTLIFASTAFAGPGKPGKNAIAPNANIVDVAIAANDLLDAFNTVLAAAQCDYFEGAVVGILSGKKRVTLFAPVDTAFDELGLNPDNVCEAFDGSEDALGAPEDLLGILAYHVTNGRRFSNSVFDEEGDTKHIRMLSGGSITTSEGMIYDNNMRAVGVVAPLFDINASNGVIHVIDRVLLP